jgi:hypothetical protein
VGQVQVFGLASAAAVAERYVGTVDRHVGRRDTSGKGATVPVTRAVSAEILHLPPAPRGSKTTTCLWVHNPTAVSVTLTMHLSNMVSAQGDTIPTRALAVDPAVTTVEPGGAAQVWLSVAVPNAMPPGHYHGIVTSTATPRQSLPIHLEVQAGAHQT